MNKYYLYDALTKFKNFTLVGLYRYIRLKIQGKEVRVEGACRMCGRCCQEISLEVNGRWITSRKRFEQVIERYPEYARFSVIGKDSQGFLLFTCDWYLPEGICRDHENRLSICREFPLPSLYLAGGNVPLGCGYRLTTCVPFASILKKEIKQHQHHDPPSDSPC